MKIYKKYSAIIEWFLAIILILICSKIIFPGSFTPLKAHEQSEKSVYYGPSNIIKTIDLGKEKIYLCKYKDWFSIDIIRKGLIKWHPVNYPAGYPIDYSKQVTFNTYTSKPIKNSEPIAKIYGYVNDPQIKNIVLEDNNNKIISNYELDENKMFILTSHTNNEKNKANYIKGLDTNGNIIYEEELKYF
ncbi:TPA: hypothetical protein ACY4SF_001931 [Clostridium perfringens]|uniref:hypothetical protein n=1 Tax=Clostridium perfringens TaxID=1502 RepID=UPI000DA403E9|nr:hypothetical protein [Clostridium perfringens]EGT0697021.1 hypothetical protein [Clostridium perfringens]EGT2192898.1 hypothetical protein [Clostridium perfringens]EHA0992620.1 hypothetical protein [Clostridium perfringens]EHA1183290.1 hypothetical protein [Clostridium perfringens]EJT6143858.1 hypothetical protein [Clostridium perfringens]